jgi:hypothetical protein
MERRWVQGSGFRFRVSGFRVQIVVAIVVAIFVEWIIVVIVVAIFVDNDYDNDGRLRQGPSLAGFHARTDRRQFKERRFARGRAAASRRAAGQWRAEGFRFQEKGSGFRSLSQSNRLSDYILDILTRCAIMLLDFLTHRERMTG